MSALGHKQTYAVQKVMSALPPIATAKADSRKRSCLLYPGKQTCAAQRDVCFGPIADIQERDVSTILLVFRRRSHRPRQIRPQAEGDEQLRYHEHRSDQQVHRIVHQRGLAVLEPRMTDDLQRPADNE